jgi:hypothetical protein
MSLTDNIIVAVTWWQMKSQAKPKKLSKCFPQWVRMARTLANVWVWIIFMHLLNTGSANWVNPVPSAYNKFDTKNLYQEQGNAYNGT